MSHPSQSSYSPQPGDPDFWKHPSLPAIFPDFLWVAVTISTSFAVLYGLFVTLAVVSAYLLLRRGVRRPSVAIQLFAVTALFVSTTTHWSIVVLQRFGGLLSHPNDVSVGANTIVFLPQQCVGTATLTSNIVLSDLIVWWRVWVLLQDSRLLYRRTVHICGCALLVAMFATGVVDTHFSCTGHKGFMYEGLAVGTAASTLSLATNLAATTLTAYKAWDHRKCIRGHLASGSRSTQVESIFALLVESGALYCTLWVVVVVWQIGARINDPHMRSSVFLSPPFSDKHHFDLHSFWFRGGVLIEGCLVPLIAIYPTSIIVLVALNKSAVENGAKRDTECPPAIAVAVETIVDTHSDVEDLAARTPSNTMEGDSSSDFSHPEKRFQ